jgi:hypothetical protein
VLAHGLVQCFATIQFRSNLLSSLIRTLILEWELGSTASRKNYANYLAYFYVKLEWER